MIIFISYWFLILLIRHYFIIDYWLFHYFIDIDYISCLTILRHFIIDISLFSFRHWSFTPLRLIDDYAIWLLIIIISLITPLITLRWYFITPLLLIRLLTLFHFRYWLLIIIDYFSLSAIIIFAFDDIDWYYFRCFHYYCLLSLRHYWFSPLRHYWLILLLLLLITPLLLLIADDISRFHYFRYCFRYHYYWYFINIIDAISITLMPLMIISLILIFSFHWLILLIIDTIAIIDWYYAIAIIAITIIFTLFIIDTPLIDFHILMPLPLFSFYFITPPLIRHI
jgi:hypothetical protein